MAQPVIDHSRIRGFTEQRVNLPSNKVKEYRDQVNGLRERLADYIAENPGFALVKMLHAGSVAKGTALRTINDLDVSVYMKKEESPISDEQLVPWLAERLREVYPNMTPDQLEIQPHCITVKFKGSGLDVDVVPLLYEGDKNDLGYLVDKDTGERTMTSIPLHLNFIRNRKKVCPTHFAQVIRLVKWWAKHRKTQDPTFKCKSFMLELILSHLLDKSMDMSRYPDALEEFFSYIVKAGLEERISFTDYYPPTHLPERTDAPIEIIDPVNPSNNVACLYTTSDRDRLVEAAEEAGDAIAEAHYSTTKTRAIECWQIVLGPSFRG